MKTADIVIVGGGIMGWCTAYNLLNEGFTGRVVVIERDPLRKNTSTSLAVGGFRQQFGTEINIRVVRYSVEFYENFAELMETPKSKPDISLCQKGYLFLASESSWPTFKRRFDTQRRHGVEVSLLSVDEATELLPEMDAEGVVGAAFCPRDGYLDPYSVLQAFEAKARLLGAVSEYAEVTRIGQDSSGVTCVHTADEIIHTRMVVNAAGAWAGELARMASVDLCVRPWRRQVYVCRTALRDREFPMVIDTTGVHFRSETGNRIVAAGVTPSDCSTFDIIWDKPAFEDIIWPALANRIPCFDSLLLENGWGGLYDENPIDHNAIVGMHPDLNGFYLINGFSGHGLMQAPAAGKGLAELILHGEYKSIDLKELSASRFKTGELVIEEAVI